MIIFKETFRGRQNPGTWSFRQQISLIKPERN